MNRGVPPTARNARTGEFTPPGITRWARSNRSAETGASTCPVWQGRAHDRGAHLARAAMSMLHLRVICPPDLAEPVTGALRRAARRRRDPAPGRLEPRLGRSAPTSRASARTTCCATCTNSASPSTAWSRSIPSTPRSARCRTPAERRRPRRGRGRAHLGRAHRAHRRGRHPHVDLPRVHGARDHARRRSASSPTRRSRSSARWSSARSSARWPGSRSRSCAAGRASRGSRRSALVVGFAVAIVVVGLLAVLGRLDRPDLADRPGRAATARPTSSTTPAGSR